MPAGCWSVVQSQGSSPKPERSAHAAETAVPPGQAADFPVGIYDLTALVVRPGETDARESNRLACVIAPSITSLPAAPVVRDGDGLVFVEVKRGRSFDSAIDHLRPRQIARLQRAAEEFVGTQPLGMLTDMRFDVALVDGVGAIRVIENAIGF